MSPERKLVDEEGENQAVRGFLMLYGQPGVTAAQMKRHMELLGYPHAPEWVERSPGHLTKAGAQLWLRMLFELEGAALTAAQPAPKHEALARKLRANADDYRQRRQYPTDEHAAKLFTAAADALTAAQPALLTDAEIEAIADSVRVDAVDSQRTTWHKRFARAIERRVRGEKS